MAIEKVDKWFRFVALVLAVIAVAGKIISDRDSFRASLYHFSLHSKSSSGGVASESLVSDSSELCHSKTIISRSVTPSSTPAVPDGYDLLQATVHMRHLDRWMYQHDLIGNVCWTGQANSSHPSMKNQCRYNLSLVWEKFEFTSDPYAYPAKGECNAKQLTTQGKLHAEILGRAYGNMFTAEERRNMCKAGSGKIVLEAHEEQKNQLSAQHVYQGFCGKIPDASELKAEVVLDRGIIELGRPFFLHLALCGSEFLTESLHKANHNFVNDNIDQLMNLTTKLAMISGKKAPENTLDFVQFLDNEIDCYFSHSCHGLRDIPSRLNSFMKDANELETLSRAFAFDYIEANGVEGEEGKYRQFVASYFGYYFSTVLHRMRLVLEPEAHGLGPDTKTSAIPSLYIQVTTDQILSTLLRILGARRHEIRQRPRWGSQVIFQLLQLRASIQSTGQVMDAASLYVRIIYEGQVIKMQPFKAFANFVDNITPSDRDCPEFHNNFPYATKR